MTTTTTATETRAWVIRPTRASGEVRYLAVAIDRATGFERVIRDRGISFETIRAARLAIIRQFDGGRSFPEIKAPVAWVTPTFIPEPHRDACYYFAPVAIA